MTGAKMKLMVNQQGVTIAGDNFHFTSGTQVESGLMSPDDIVFGVAESAQLEIVIAKLEMMTRRTYGQFCGLARALELLGERWAPLIIRDLLVGPKGIADLQAGLPRIPADVLAARLREFERAGVVRRRVAPEPDNSVRYELTEYGAELDDVILRLGSWGARMLGTPRAGEIVTVDSLVMAMRGTFQPAAAEGLHVTFQLRMGDILLHMRVDDGELTAAAGPLPGADLSFEPGASLRGLLTGEINPEQAVEDGSVPVIGDPALLALFTRLFRIGANVQRSARPAG